MRPFAPQPAHKEERSMFCAVAPIRKKNQCFASWAAILRKNKRFDPAIHPFKENFL